MPFPIYIHQETSEQNRKITPISRLDSHLPINKSPSLTHGLDINIWGISSLHHVMQPRVYFNKRKKENIKQSCKTKNLEDHEVGNNSSMHNRVRAWRVTKMSTLMS